MADTLRETLQHQGFVVLRRVFAASEVDAINAKFESAIDTWEDDLAVSRQEYLHAVCRWSSPNPLVDALAARCTAALAPLVEDLAGPGFAPGRASLFRKSSAASLGTHGHQDAGYWVRPSSRRYALTTWVALDPVDAERGALRMLPGSHLGVVEPPVDYLRPDFEDPANAWGGETVTVDAQPGDVVVFGPTLWHASHAVVGGAIRRSLALRWVSPRQPSILAPLPDQDGRFGMYSSGERLMQALGELAGRKLPWGLSSVSWALRTGLVDTLSRPAAARAALERLCVYLRAVEHHHASDQRGMAWDAVRDDVVMPVLGPG